MFKHPPDACSAGDLGGLVMKTRYTVVLSMIAGAAVGAAAIQGLHAQAKPKAYMVTELEVIDAEANKAFTQAVRAAQQQASGRNLRTAYGKVVAFVGDPPKHLGITEFDSAIRKPLRISTRCATKPLRSPGSIPSRPRIRRPSRPRPPGRAASHSRRRLSALGDTASDAASRQRE